MEVALHFLGDLVGQVVPRVEHREHDALDLEARVHAVLHAVDRRHQVGEALERVVLALQRDEHAVGRVERVHREQAQRRRAVDEDVVEVFFLGEESAERVLEEHVAVGVIDELDLEPHEVLRRGRDAQGGDVGADEDLAQRRAADECIIHTALDAPRSHSHAGARVALRVHVEQERLLLGGRDARREVHRGRRLPDAALLVHDGEDARALFGRGHEQRGRNVYRLRLRAATRAVTPTSKPSSTKKRSAFLDPPEARSMVCPDVGASRFLRRGDEGDAEQRERDGVGAAIGRRPFPRPGPPQRLLELLAGP